MESFKVLRVGILGCDEVARLIHLPTLALLSHLYKVVSVSDILPSASAYCASKFHIPHHVSNPQETIDHPEVDLIFNLTSDDQHAPLTIAGLKAGKDVMLEKPSTLSLLSAESMLEAERVSLSNSGARVFVGYMRRYAPSFVGAFKDELKTLGPIKYVRVRDIIGANSYFVGQSETKPTEINNFSPGTSSLGSHDLSLMREALGGLPTRVDAVAAHGGFYNALMTYTNSDGSEYAVSYESGIDDVPWFDAHIQVYGQHKTVRIQYDTPFVKGLPIVVHVDEKGPSGEKVARTLQNSYEDAYTAELRELWSCLVEGKDVKTSLEDACDDLKLFDIMYRRHDLWDNNEP